MTILNFWPFKDSPPRKTQVEVLKWIESIADQYRYIICEIPVGGGKSPIAMNVSAWLANRHKTPDSFTNNLVPGNSFILTPQKILQKQYEDSFPKISFSFYGKGNYSCDMKGTNCEIGNLIKPKCNPCCHKEAYERALNSHNLIMNYTLAITYKLTPADLMRRRNLMVFDECHNIEKQLIDMFGVYVSKSSCKRYQCDFVKPDSISEAYNFIKDEYMSSIESWLVNNSFRKDEILNKMSKGNNVSKQETIELEEFQKAEKHLMMVELLVDKSLENFANEHVLIHHPESFEIKELFARNIFSNFFEGVADKFLFMSSTILDKDAFCDDLGIDPDQTAFISMPSEFAIENRHVNYLPIAKMTYGWDSNERAKDRKNMIEAIISICNDMHENDSGVIHTGSYQVSSWLVRELNGKIKHKIYHHNSDSDIGRDSAINSFMTDKTDKPKLLISPSVTEGLDLKNDLGRFSIIAKVPFPYLGDAWVKKRAELSNKWYNLQAMKSIIQASGRVVRTNSDWGATYILDESFMALYNRLRHCTPKWWKDALVLD
jgi:ATP-dependent DNA helicase DinG